jgi:phage terminase large subunit
MEFDKIVLRPYQEKFLMSADRFPAMIAGIGTGKSLMLILKIWLFCEKHPKSRALVVRNEFTDLHDSTIKDFQDKFHVTVGSNKEYQFPNGSVILFRHGSELNTLKNITLDIAAIEQAEEFVDETQFTFIRDRLRGRNGPYQQLCIIANACGHNWIWKMWVNNPKPEYSLVIANSFENECNLPAEFVKDLRRMALDAPRHYAQYVMNSFEEMEQDDFVFNFSELTDARNRVYASRVGYGHRVMGFDIARYGNDKCAAVGIEQVGALVWRTFHVEQWDHKDLDYTTGRIIAISAQHGINDNIIDEDGIGGGPLDFIVKGRKRNDYHENTKKTF